MARKPMVTRTIQTTRATVLCLNIQEGTPFSTEVVLPRTYKDEKGLLKAAENALNTDTVKAVHISGATVQETLYGIRLAKPMEGRGKFATDANDDTNTDDSDTADEDDTSAADEGNPDDDGQGEPDTNGEGNNADSWGNP